MKATKKIGGYIVDYESGDEMPDYEGRPQCWVRYGPYHASLAALQATGVLESDDSAMAVPSMHLHEIEVWAKEQGYES
jgi:hypothetical protein